MVIRGHQRSSEVIRGHQRSSEAIRGHQRPSEVIRGHQRPSEVISATYPLASTRSAGTRSGVRHPLTAPSSTTEYSAAPQPPLRTTPAEEEAPRPSSPLPSSPLSTRTRAPGHTHQVWPPSTQKALIAAKQRASGGASAERLMIKGHAAMPACNASSRIGRHACPSEREW